MWRWPHLMRDPLAQCVNRYWWFEVSDESDGAGVSPLGIRGWRDRYYPFVTNPFFGAVTYTKTGFPGRTNFPQLHSLSGLLRTFSGFRSAHVTKRKDCGIASEVSMRPRLRLGGDAQPRWLSAFVTSEFSFQTTTFVFGSRLSSPR